MKSTFKDVFNVMSSNFIYLLSSVLTGFIMPMILGTTNYGHYEIFMLYSTYTALLHFGFVDGVLLTFGGNQYKDLNVKKFRVYTIFFIWFQLVVSIILASFSLFTLSSFYKILFISLGVYTFLFNIITYYQFISQAIMRFKELSIQNIVRSALIVFLVIVFFMSYKLNIITKPNYIYYICIILLVNVILFIWYIFRYKNITFGNHYKFIECCSDIKNFFIHGFYMTVSYQISMLVFNLDNQFVSYFFSAAVYGVYAFAYSLMSISLTILGAVSTVLFPHLNRESNKNMVTNYSNIISITLIIVFLCLIGYFPLCIIIKLFLYKYVKSLIYLRILLPGLGLNCCISLVIFNYYNVLKKSKFYFNLSIIILFFSVFVYYSLYILFRTSISIAFGSLVSLLLWYLLTNYFMVRWYKVHWIKNIFYIIFMFLVFFFSVSFNNLFISFLSYLIGYILLSIIMFRKMILNIIIELLE